MYKLGSNSSPIPPSSSSEDSFPCVENRERECSELSTTLPVSAASAYALFVDCERTPEWMSIIRMARILRKREDGRPLSAAFIANLDHASLGYTLSYDYQDSEFSLSWSTSAQVNTQISGKCSFVPLGDKACMMHYEVCRESDGQLPEWGDEMYQGHPASAALCEFRDFINRTKHEIGQ